VSLRKAIEVVARLSETGVVQHYAVAGAVAALNYIQPMLTEDLDILVSIGGFDVQQSGLILLTPIEAALSRMGYSRRSDVGIWIEGWPVQFLPVASALDEEALVRAAEAEFENEEGPAIRAPVLRAEYLVATAVKLGRPKDLVRAAAFLEQKAVDLGELKSVLERFDLLLAWKAFCFRSGIADPLG
jgi:hypothetical protein